jgi:hypothetical protein
MAWALAMERASGLEEDITIPAGRIRQPRSWSALTKKKKANDLTHGAPKAGAGHLNRS